VVLYRVEGGSGRETRTCENVIVNVVYDTISIYIHACLHNNVHGTLIANQVPIIIPFDRASGAVDGQGPTG